MPRIYISHRPEDSSRNEVAMIRERLIAEFGADNILESTGSTMEITTNLQRMVQSCDVLLVVIGQYWLNMMDEKGNLLLEDPYDPIHVEIDAGLKTLMVVKFMLVDGVSAPSVDAVPEVLRGLMLKDIIVAPDDMRLSRALDEFVLEVEPITTGTMAQENGIDISTLDVPKQANVQPRPVLTESSTGLIKIVPESEVNVPQPAEIPESNPFYSTLVIMIGLVALVLGFVAVLQNDNQPRSTSHTYTHITGEEISSVSIRHLQSYEQETTNIGFVNSSDTMYYLVENRNGGLKAYFIESETPRQNYVAAPPFGSMARQVENEYPKPLPFEREANVRRFMSVWDKDDEIAVVITADWDVVVADAGTNQYGRVQKFETLSNRVPVPNETLLYNDAYNLFVFLASFDDIELWQINTVGILSLRGTIELLQSRGKVLQIAMSANGQYLVARWEGFVSLYELTYNSD